MSGVIDENGQQWEHCNRCGKFVEIQTLWYERPTQKFPYGRDLCKICAGGSTSEVIPPYKIKTVTIKV